MARPREFDEVVVLDAAVECFWAKGYEATSVRDLIETTGLTGASLYNAFGGKRALFRRALDHYVDCRVADRIRRSETLPPLEAIRSFFAEIIKRSLGDPQRKGCMLINSAIDIGAHDNEFRHVVGGVLSEVEGFFRRCVERGHADGTITSQHTAETLSRHLLGVLVGIRVLARIRPERSLLESIVGPSLNLLEVNRTPAKSDYKRKRHD